MVQLSHPYMTTGKTIALTTWNFIGKVMSLLFFNTQLSLWSKSYMITGKTIAWTTWNFVGKVMSLLFNRLSRLVIAFLPRSKSLLTSWLQSPSAVILEPK